MVVMMGCDQSQSVSQTPSKKVSSTFDKVASVAEAMQLRRQQFSKEEIELMKFNLYAKKQGLDRTSKRSDAEDMETATQGLITNAEWEVVLEAANGLSNDYPEFLDMDKEERLLFLQELFPDEEEDNVNLSKTNKLSCRERCKNGLARNLLAIGGTHVSGTIGCAFSGPLAVACVVGVQGLSAFSVGLAVWDYYDCVDGCS